MAMSVTLTERETGMLDRKTNKYAFAWTSAADGTATHTTKIIGGTIVGVSFVPGIGGAQPTNAYDVTLTDDNGVDVLSGQGANLSNATATRVVPGVPFKDGTTTSIAPIAIDDTLDLAVSNAGDSKTGQVVLYVR